MITSAMRLWSATRLSMSRSGFGLMAPRRSWGCGSSRPKARVHAGMADCRDQWEKIVRDQGGHVLLSRRDNLAAYFVDLEAGLSCARVKRPSRRANLPRAAAALLGVV